MESRHGLNFWVKSYCTRFPKPKGRNWGPPSPLVCSGMFLHNVSFRDCCFETFHPLLLHFMELQAGIMSSLVSCKQFWEWWKFKGKREDSHLGRMQFLAFWGVLSFWFSRVLDLKNPTLSLKNAWFCFTDKIKSLLFTLSCEMRNACQQELLGWLMQSFSWGFSLGLLKRDYLPVAALRPSHKAAFLL